MTFYDDIGVSQTASLQEIKVAYRKLARTLHPDVSTLDPQTAKILFGSVAQAYETLSDPEKRKVYDRRLNEPVAPSWPNSSSPGYNPFETPAYEYQPYEPKWSAEKLDGEWDKVISKPFEHSYTIRRFLMRHEWVWTMPIVAFFIWLFASKGYTGASTAMISFAFTSYDQPTVSYHPIIGAFIGVVVAAVVTITMTVHAKLTRRNKRKRAYTGSLAREAYDTGATLYVILFFVGMTIGHFFF